MAGDEHTIVHEPLDISKSQIRVLHLQPRSNSDSITCGLSVMNLDDAGTKYEALSYEWGDSTSISSIFLEGKKVAVRENLWWALWHLRHKENIRVIWIDALCIDQNSIRERNHQVAQMARVYSQAACVIAWVGKVRQRTSRGLSWSNALETAAFVQHLVKWSKIREKDRTQQVWPQCVSSCLDKESQSCWNSLVHFSRRSYWTRLWIIQETLLAQNLLLQCDNIEIPGADLERAFQHFEFITWYIRDPRHQLSFPLRNIIRSTALFKIFQQRDPLSTRNLKSASLFDTLYLYSEAKCENVRDKAHGLLGVVSSCCRNALHVNYEIALSELCEAILQHHCLFHQPGISGVTRDVSVKIQTIVKLFHNETLSWWTFQQQKAEEKNYPSSIFVRLLDSPVQLRSTDQTIGVVQCGFMGLVLQSKTHLFPGQQLHMTLGQYRHGSETDEVYSDSETLTEADRTPNALPLGLPMIEDIPILSILDMSGQCIRESILPERLTTQLRNVLDSILSEKEILGSNIQSGRLCKIEHSPILASGSVAAGDLLYRLCYSRMAIFLRWNGVRLRIVATTWSLDHPHHLWTDSLPLEYPQLRDLCLVHASTMPQTSDSLHLGFMSKACLNPRSELETPVLFKFPHTE